MMNEKKMSSCGCNRAADAEMDDHKTKSAETKDTEGRKEAMSEPDMDSKNTTKATKSDADK